MNISKLTNYIESIAPPAYQESYDNAGLIVGNPNWELTGVMICLDSTEAVLDEAIEKGCNLVLAHHPIVFKGLKRFNGCNYVERVVMKAIKHDIAIYAAHTNLDNVAHGVNAKICDVIGLTNTQILAPKQKLRKLYTYTDINAVETIRKALHAINTDQVGAVEGRVYASVGASSSNGIVQSEVRLEVNYHQASERQIVKTLQKTNPRHNAAIDIMPVENLHPRIGSGMIGDLEKPISPGKFLKELKESMNVSCIRHTNFLNKKVVKIAVCGGSGGFLLNHAIQAGADVFVTADYKYHEFFDADNKIVIADIGHYESEQFTIELFNDFITKKFSTFAVHLTSVNTNPVNYL